MRRRAPLRRVRIDGKPHPAAVDEEIRDASALGKVLEVAHREDRKTRRPPGRAPAHGFRLREAPYTTWHSVSRPVELRSPDHERVPFNHLVIGDLNERVGHLIVAADADDNGAAGAQRVRAATW